MLRRMILLFVATCIVLMFADVGWAANFRLAQNGYAAKVFFSPYNNNEGFAFIGDNDYAKSQYPPLDLYQTKDGGENWSKRLFLLDNRQDDYSQIVQAYFSNLAYSPDGSIYLSGYNIAKGEPFLCVSNDNGEHWQTVKDVKLLATELYYGGENHLLAIFGDKIDDLAAFIGLPRTGILKSSTNGGKTWVDLTGGKFGGGNNIAAANDTICLITDGIIKVSNDRGSFWEKKSEVKTDGQQPSFIASNGTNVVVVNPNYPACVYVSTDSGKTWRAVDKAQFTVDDKSTPMSIAYVDVASEGYIVAATTDGLVMISKDSGKTWGQAGIIPSKVLGIAALSNGATITIVTNTDNGIYRMEIERTADLPKITSTSQIENPQVPKSSDTSQKIEFKIGEQGYKINGSTVNTDAGSFIDNDRTYVPVRFLANALGIEDKNIIWDEQSQTIQLLGNKTVKLSIGDDKLTVDNNESQMGVEPLVRDGRAYLPARFVAVAFGYKVSWDDSTQTVVITK